MGRGGSSSTPAGDAAYGWSQASATSCLGSQCSWPTDNGATEKGNKVWSLRLADWSGREFRLGGPRPSWMRRHCRKGPRGMKGRRIALIDGRVGFARAWAVYFCGRAYCTML